MAQVQGLEEGQMKAEKAHSNAVVKAEEGSWGSINIFYHISVCFLPHFSLVFS